ncbi:MAG: glycine/betaine/sarcosine/D-proline family reductase selenoprotein B, partial [Actinomycetota bacterium]
MRVVHYLNQFFAGVGGEDRAADPPAVAEGPVGPGRKLAALLGDGLPIVATVWCGDDHAASDMGAAAEIVALAREAGAEMILCGPAFGSGRYGIACARVAALATRAGLPAVAGMDPDNPGLPETSPAI